MRKLDLSRFQTLAVSRHNFTWSKLFLGLAGVEGGPGLLDVGQQFHPLVDLLSKLVAQTVRLCKTERLSNYVRKLVHNLICSLAINFLNLIKVPR